MLEWVVREKALLLPVYIYIYAMKIDVTKESPTINITAVIFIFLPSLVLLFKLLTDRSRRSSSLLPSPPGCYLLLYYCFFFFSKSALSLPIYLLFPITHCSGVFFFKSAVPGLPLIGNLHQLKEKKPHLTFFRWSAEYGPVFTIRTGAFTVAVLNSTDAAKEVK